MWYGPSRRTQISVIPAETSDGFDTWTCRRQEWNLADRRRVDVDLWRRLAQRRQADGGGELFAPLELEPREP
jgi:hypothetical protein